MQAETAGWPNRNRRGHWIWGSPGLMGRLGGEAGRGLHLAAAGPRPKRQGVVNARHRRAGKLLALKKQRQPQVNSGTIARTKRGDAGEDRRRPDAGVEGGLGPRRQRLAEALGVRRRA